MDPIKVDFAKKDKARKRDVVIPPEKAGLKLALSLVGTLLFAGILYYFMLPAFNFKCYDMYLYLGLVAASFAVFLALFTKAPSKPEYTPYVRKNSIVSAVIIGVLVLTVAIGWLVGCQLFRAKDYAKLISSTGDTHKNSENKTFNGSDAIWSYKFDDEKKGMNAEALTTIPKIDEDAATKLANKALSNLSNSEQNLVSQFILSSDSTQINLNGEPVRVFPLQYSNIIKWLTNTSSGLPGYVTVNMATEQYEYVSLKDAKVSNITYSPAEHFNHLLKRHLRFEYPTFMFGDETFEVDDNMNPYWIVPVLDKKIGLFGGEDIKGAVICEATGKCHYFSIEEISTGKAANTAENNGTITDGDLTWIDRAYTADLVVAQFDNFGKYNGGFFNSFLGQRQTYVSSEGHSFVAMEDDVWLYTGVTSVTSDESLTGFVLINQRTKEVRYYNVPGSTETAAQTTAQGRVQEKDYIATFPLLINVQGQPTYFIALKDASSVVQQYALVNVEDYNTILVVADKSELGALRSAYETKLIDNGKVKEAELEEVKEDDSILAPDTDKPADSDSPVKGEDGSLTVTGKIEKIVTAVKDGNTYYYIKLDSGESFYSISVKSCETVITLSVGDEVTVTCAKDGEGIIPATDIK